MGSEISPEDMKEISVSIGEDFNNFKGFLEAFRT
jgi:hypothetical protein